MCDNKSVIEIGGLKIEDNNGDVTITFKVDAIIDYKKVCKYIISKHRLSEDEVFDYVRNHMKDFTDDKYKY